MLHRSPPRGSTSLSSKLAICCFLLRVSCSEGLLSPQFKAASKSSLALAADRVVVALTREEGKNDKLVQHIKRNPELDSQIDLLELPCIEHAGGPDFEKLGETLLSQRWDYVAVTSPEAARVVASAWDVVRDNPLPVVAVGKATEKTLQKFGIPVTFTPSKATAKVLAQELEYKGEGTTLLYLASVRAQDTLESGLMARGFAVTRLNTYDTITATWSEEQKEKAKKVKVACFASPSSIKGWLSNTGDNKDVMAACIGETSAKACRGHSWSESQIFFPESPGLEGWSNSIAESIKDLQNAVHSYSK
jgi:uroporphyrinogen-III synthase